MKHTGLRIINFVFFIFCVFHSFAQFAVSLKGIVKDQSTSAPIPYVNVLKKGGTTGVITNSEGLFQLSFLTNGSDSITFSSIGYKTLTLPIDALATDTLQLKLVPEIYPITPVSVSATLTAFEIVKKAKEMIPFTYYSGASRLNGYYREYTKENEKYGRLVEALVSVYDKGFAKRNAQAFEITALKKSAASINCFPETRRQNHLYDLFSDDPIRYNELFPSGELEKMTFKTDSICYFESEAYYAISFTSASQNGRLLINKEDYSILLLETVKAYYYSMPDDAFKFKIAYSYTIRNRKYDHKLFVSSISYNMRMEDADPITKQPRKMELQSEFMSSNIYLTSGEIPDTKKWMDTKKDVFLQYNSFNCPALDSANTLLPTQLQKRIK